MIGFFAANRIWIILSIAALFSFIWLLAFDKELKIKWYGSLALALLISVFAILCSMLFAQIENLVNGVDSGNMSLFGGVFFIPILPVSFALLFKKDIRMVCDIFTPAIVFIAAMSRVNCLFGGCCLGLEIPGTSYRYPTREAELLYFFVMMLVLATRVTKKRFDGKAYPINMIGYGVFRFIIDFFRENVTLFGPFHVTHIWCVLAVVIGVTALVLINRSSANGKSSKSKN